MDDKKIVKLDIKSCDLYSKDPMQNESLAKNSKCPVPNNFLHTNPILQKMFFVNQLAKKNKFNFKDLFR